MQASEIDETAIMVYEVYQKEKFFACMLEKNLMGFDLNGNNSKIYAMPMLKHYQIAYKDAPKVYTH